MAETAAMPRLACPEEPRVTLHVVQRGRSRSPCFSCAGDRIAYLGVLCACSQCEHCAIHAYVLMGNHVHLLFTPLRANGAARLMPALAAGFSRYLLSAHGHEESPWEEPYDATPVHARRHLFTTMRYIEENPVRAGLATHPASYRWSSYYANALGGDDPLVTPHVHYYTLGRTPAARRAAYAASFTAPAAASQSR